MIEPAVSRRLVWICAGWSIPVSPFFLERPYVTLNGFTPPSEDPANAFSMRFIRTGDDRHVIRRTSNPYARIRDTMAEVMDCRNSVATVDRAALDWRAADLESAAQGAGAACTMIRSPDEWQRRGAGMPTSRSSAVIQLEKIADSPARPLGRGARPSLAGIRVLGYAHVLAGPHAGSVLAEHGADVLGLWEPSRNEMGAVYAWGKQGHRSALVDSTSAAGQATIKGLLSRADVVVASHRPSRVADAGLSVEDCVCHESGRDSPVLHLLR